MGSPACCIPILAVCAWLSLLDEALAQEPAAGSQPLSEFEQGQAQFALEILEKKAAEEPGDFGERLRKAMEAFRQVLESGRVRKGGMVEGQLGAAWGPGEELEEGKGENQVLLHEDLVAAPLCSVAFLRLMTTIVHEGTHLNQEVPPRIPLVQLNRMFEVNPEDAIKFKVRRIRHELEALEAQLQVTHQLKDAFARMHMAALGSGKKLEEVRAEDFIDAAPEWARDFASCGIVRISGFLNELRVDDIPRKEGKIESLEAILDGINTQRARRPVPRAPGRIAEWINEEKAYRDYVSGRGVRLQFDHFLLLIRGFNPDGCAWQLEAARDGRLQDVRVIADRSGFLHLLVSGTLDDESQVGFVKLFPVPSRGLQLEPIPEPIPGIVEVPLEGSGCREIVSGSPFLVRPSSILTAPDGRIWLWDVERIGLFPAVDDNQDGLPDRFDLRSMVHVPREFPAGHMASLEWVGSQPILQLRMDAPMDFGDDGVLAFMDRNLDGFFESVVPTHWTRLIAADSLGR